MPIHVYRCLNCGIVSDVFLSYDDYMVNLYCECGGELKKQIALPAIHFKGGGFYINDSKPEEKENDV